MPLFSSEISEKMSCDVQSVLVYTKKLMNRRVDMKNRDALMELKLV